MPSPPWHVETVEVGAIPTMVSREERRYLHWLGRVWWRDSGHVVEIGPWLGGSTVCLARGMRASHPSPRYRLHTFDNFRWRAFMAQYADLKLAPGDSFEPYFRRHIIDLQEWIVPHAMGLPDESSPDDDERAGIRSRESEPVEAFAWPAGEPIEILFIDGAKSWRGIHALMTRTRPALMTGRTLLVAQDYKHWAAYWVPLFLWALRAHLELVHDTIRGSTVAFRLLRPLDAGEIESLPTREQDLGLDTSLHALASAAAALAARGDDQGASQVSLSRVALLGHRGCLEDARRIYDEVRESWPAGADMHELAGARGYLERRHVPELAPLPRKRPLARLLRRWASR